MSNSLYEMTAEWQRVFEMLEDPDIPDDAIFDTIESIEATMDIKADHYAMAIRNYEGDIDKIDGEIKRLQGRKAAMKNRIQAMKDRLEDTMRSTGRTKFKTALFSFGIQKNGGKAPVVLTGDVPWVYLKPGEPDMAQIRRELEAGEALPFAKLAETGESLRIR